ncbi:MAG TPA: nitrate- and nitrite sensing domain-containing protein [Pseudonocardiaceae bacterium]|jgi:signal transduction histidine kinase|nr:nitrate- and nitrite sensing domain-containing protein [Pseudonocardiaceae bacterium]
MDSVGLDGNRAAQPAPSGTVGVVASRWRLSSWRLRQKLIAVLLVPVLATVLFAGLAVRSEITNINQFDVLRSESDLSAQASQVVDALQQERDLAMVFAASGKSSGGEEYNVSFQATDAQVAGYQSLVANDGGMSSAVRGAAATSQEGLTGLAVLRSSTQSTQYPATAVLVQYNGLIASVLQVTQAVAAESSTVGSIAPAVNLFANAKEDIAQQDSILLVAVSPGNSSPTLANDLLEAQSAYQSDITAFESVATPQQSQEFQDTVSGPNVDNRAQFTQTVLSESAAGIPFTVDTSQVQPAATDTIALYRQAELSLQSQLQSAIQSARSGAQGDVLANIVLVAVILLVAFAIMLLVSAAMVAPLRSLRTNALDVARNRLPATINRILASEDPMQASKEAVDPVPPFTEEEVGQVARSFDVIYGQAVRLATEQAVLRDNVNAIFVNLARRSQVLVERQLSLIDRLERDEQDPDQLSNLFELDHLATRMRRNSESLLVLSGSGLAKRMSQPVPIGDLVGAAVSEVEQYARVEVGSPPNAKILGRVVNDLIHLIAELLDNATVFSEPNTKVSVRIAKTRAREVAIQITDRGVGMTEEDVRYANERLANPPEMDVNVTRRMGLYVVARLAKRHNIRVKLRANEDIDGGTVALVVIGEDLIHQPGDPQGQQQGGDRALPQAAEASRAEGGAPAGAVAAAGIAGAFGIARRGEGQPDIPAPQTAEPDFSIQDQARQDQENPLDPATSFWSSEFALDQQEDSGGQPAIPAEPTSTNLTATNLTPINLPLTNQSAMNQSGTNLPPVSHDAASTNSGQQPSSLWEAHTAADELPAINESTSDSAVRDRLGGAGSTPSTAGQGGLSGLSRSTGNRASAGKEAALEVDAPTERLPIYEAVLSQWFRPDEVAQPEVVVGSDSPTAPPAAAAPAPAATPPAPPEPVVEPVEEPKQTATSNGALPTRVPGKAGAAAGFGTGRRGGKSSPEVTSATNIMEPVPTPEPGPQPTAEQVASAANSAWETPADEGWQLAEALLSSPVSETTGAGLPKRVPKAHLVPGSAAARASSQQAEQPPLPPRSADAVRGRMSSFQRGVRRGRHALIEAYSGGASPLSDGSHDEEHE